MKIWLSVLFGIILYVSALGQVDNSGTKVTKVLKNPGYMQLDPDLLEAFLDGMIKAAMEERHLPGMSVSIVQNGELILAKGYGLARTNPPQQVVADKTLFRIGSVSKVFTFSAVMQLVEQGLLDLNADIRTYVNSSRIEDKFGPFTMVDLMTHSAGFEDAYLGFFYANDIKNDLTPTDYLNRYAHHRVRLPGEQIVYSNFGVNLAGKVIESVSGENFADYMEAHIFQPLGMIRSSFRDYPKQAADGYLNPELEKDRAIAYRWAGGKFVPYNKFFMSRAQYPAGSMSATATDVAVFMLAHLNGGAIDGKRILAVKTVEQMHTRLLGNSDSIQGNAHGFWTGQIRGYRTVEHSGSVLGFLSNMVLIPELELGIFVTTNGDAGYVISSMARHIIENFYASLNSPLQPDPAFSAKSKVYSGQYLSNRRGYKIIDKMASLGAEITVSITGDGYLITTSGNFSERWLPMGNHVFENADNGSRIAFKVGKSGVATRLVYGSDVADRISFLSSSQFFYITTGLTLVLAFGCLFGFWLRRGKHPVQSGVEKLASLGVGINSLVWLLFFAAYAAFFSNAFVPEPDFFVNYPTPLAWFMHLSATVASILVVLNTFGLFPVWLVGSWSLWRRLRHTLIVVAGLALVLALNEWNVLGFRYLG